MHCIVFFGYVPLTLRSRLRSANDQVPVWYVGYAEFPSCFCTIRTTRSYSQKTCYRTGGEPDHQADQNHRSELQEDHAERQVEEQEELRR